MSIYFLFQKNKRKSFFKFFIIVFAVTNNFQIDIYHGYQKLSIHKNL